MSFRAWGPKQNLVYALATATTQTNAVQPVGFVSGGNQCKILNTGTSVVMVAFWSHASGDPTLTFPVTGAPPVGQGGAGRQDMCVVVVAPGAEKQVSIPATADSFGNILPAAATAATILVQRGDGSA